MQPLQSSTFKRSVKKLHANQKAALDDAVRLILANPLIAEQKIGDLSQVFVYKFYMIDQLTLLAYRYDPEYQAILLLALGAHENFYRDLKLQIR